MKWLPIKAYSLSIKYIQITLLSVLSITTTPIYSPLNSKELAVVMLYSTVRHLTIHFLSPANIVSWGWDKVQTTAPHQALQLHNVTLTPGDRLCQGWCPGLKLRLAKLHYWCPCHSMCGSSAWQCITTTKCDIFQKLSNCSLKSGLDWGPRQRTAAGLSICP